MASRLLHPRTTILLRPPHHPRRTITSTQRLSIKEDASRTPEQIEASKQEQLKEQARGQGRWREDLASHGESSIAADKQGVADHSEHMKELQDQGKKKGEEGAL